MKKEFSDYYLGLDIGTNSVGWAVTNKEYNILKFNRKSMWGIRLFEEAETAEVRRGFRSSRRRNDRKKYRLTLLRELLGEEIYKKDEGFFRRLDDSFYYSEDKEINQKNTLFNDEDYNDKDFHKEYPTIYHLRKALLEEDKKFDIRLIFLGINSIVKNRGHFLYEGQSFSIDDSLNKIVDEYIEDIQSNLGIEFEIPSKEKFINILRDEKLNITNKVKELKKTAGFTTKEKQQNAILELISGKSVKLSVLFDDESLKEEEIKDIKLSDNSFEEKKDSLEEILGDRFYIVEKGKAIYDNTILEKILKGEKYISYAKVKSYEDHKEDLKKLKDYIKEYGKKYFDDLFKNVKENNYSSYVKNYKTVIDHSKNKNSKKEDFYKYLKSILEKCEDTEEKKYFIDKMEIGEFLPLQRNTENSVIPYQVNKMELENILENISKYYSFIDEKDEDGISIREKIISLLTFRIPYYVGPLNGYHKDTGFAWIEKKLDEKIYPWNFEKVVDLEKSGEAFIKKMTNKCTYILGEDVLPRFSLLYSEYTVLNEINKLKINGEPIDVEVKNELVEKLFKKQKKISIKNIKDYLLKNNYISKEDMLTGVDINLSSTLSSYIDLKKIIGTKVENKETTEKLILYRTLYEDKKLFAKRIKDEFKDYFSKEEIRKLKELRFTGWGRLSEKLLLGIEGENLTENTTGEITNIIGFLRETTDNLMEILSSRYSISKKIEKYNKDYMNKMGIGQYGRIDYKIVEELYLSPKVKRSTWQTMQIVKEIRKITGKDPKKIFVEVAREEGEKARTTSRQKQLEELYKNCDKDKEFLLNKIKDKNERDFRSKKLYLYYLQMGKCMYSGETIDISNLYNDKLYDIDHVFPRSITKDNSLDNLVLVKRNENMNKGDIYPIDKNIQNRMKNFWYILKDKNFITESKFNRLTRTTDLTADEKAAFIARQIVETRQSSKAVADLLKTTCKDSKLVYVKAGNVSDFRQEFNLLKNRDINDYHHGKDAYLNIVVGNVYNTEFTDNPINFTRKAGYREYNLQKLFQNTVERNKEKAWDTENNKSISNVKNQMKRNDLQYTRLPYIRKSGQNGGLFDQNLLKKSNDKERFPIKKSDKRLLDGSKYGGYGTLTVAYLSLVKYEKVSKGKTETVISLESVPLYIDYEIKNKKTTLEEYFTQIGILNPEVLIEKIKFDTLFQLNGFKYYNRGKSNDFILYQNAIQLVVGEKEEEYLRKISKFIQKSTKEKNTVIGKYDGINKEGNLNIFDTLVDKLNNSIYSIEFSRLGTQIKDARNVFKGLSVEDQCIVINEILHLFQSNSIISNLIKIKLNKFSGKVQSNKNINKKDSAYIINQSITGLFEEKIDLLKL